MPGNLQTRLLSCHTLFSPNSFLSSLFISSPFLTLSSSSVPLGPLLSSKARNTHLLSTYGMPSNCLCCLNSSLDLRPISTDLWSLLSPASFCSLPGKEMAFIEHLLCTRQFSYTPLPLDSICSFISDFSSSFLLICSFLGKKTSNYGAQLTSPLISSCLFLPASLALPASPFPCSQGKSTSIS